MMLAMGRRAAGPNAAEVRMGADAKDFRRRTTLRRQFLSFVICRRRIAATSRIGCRRITASKSGGRQVTVKCFPLLT
jgi:hypothetical protein